MYPTILLTVDASPADRPIVDHIKKLAQLCHSRVILFHVADGWAAREFKEDAVCDEVRADREYLEELRKEFEAENILTETVLAYGEPKKEILKWVEEKGCSLIAMGTHGHRLMGDLLFGSTATHVQHRVTIPVLMLRA